MDIHCGDNWLFHDWGINGKCTRCGVTGVHVRGNPPDVTSDDDPSLSASLSPARPVDPVDRHGSRHHRRSKADGSSFVAFVRNLACSAAL